MAKICLIINDIRSAHNAGSLLRTADCLGVEHVYLTGYSPYPLQPNDSRLPHQIHRAMKQLQKTALGAESNKNITYVKDVNSVLKRLSKKGYRLVALEQDKNSIDLSDYKGPQKLALLLGREVEGIEPNLLQNVDDIIEIPMAGSKESLNVAQAAAIALYELSKQSR